jgi:hypothetical protein
VQVDQANYVNSTQITNTDLWHFYCFVRSSNTLCLYIDGTMNASNTGAAAVDVTNNDVLRFGANNQSATSRQYNGSLNDIRIFNRALSGTKITFLNNLHLN